ncbi:tetratricopeptide repeat protein, partial [Salmonella enterica]
AWLMLRPNDSKSIYNLKLIKDKQSALPPPVFAAGEYWRYAGRASWNVLSVKALPTPSRYQVNFQGYWFGLMGIYF